MLASKPLAKKVQKEQSFGDNIRIPQPLRSYCGSNNDGEKWQWAGFGIKKLPLIENNDKYDCYMLSIRSGTKVPSHDHGGSEWTLVLDGAFTDEAGHFGPGDMVEMREGEEHQPVADVGKDCICLVVADAPVALTGSVGRFLNPFIGNLPKQKKFTVVSLFDSGVIDFDNNVAFINLVTLEDFFNLKPKKRNLEIYLNNPKNIEYKKTIVQKVFDDEFIYTWSDMNKSLFSALKVERNVMFIILTLIIIVAAFNIISGLTILVKNKSKEIAILKTLGFTDFSICKIFLVIGSSIGICGTVFGSLLGILISHNIENLRLFLSNVFNLEIFPAEIYFLSKMPSNIELDMIILISFFSILISILASLFPAIKASKLDPIMAIRNE